MEARELRATQQAMKDVTHQRAAIRSLARLVAIATNGYALAI